MKVRALVKALCSVALWLAALLSGGASAAGYVVRGGDTAWSLAKRHGLSVAQLRQLNRLPSDQLSIGQVLVFGEVGAGATPGAVQSGMAVYYAGRPDPETAMTAAHLTLKLGSWVRVTRLGGPSVLVKINDRGPFGRPERVIDLSLPAARALGMLSAGVAPVSLAVVSGP